MSDVPEISYLVEFLNSHDGLIEEEVYTRSSWATLLDSVRARVLHDEDLLHDCRAIEIRKMD
jgi:hypothetical protein